MIPVHPPRTPGYTLTADQAEDIARKIRTAHDAGTPVIVPADWDVLPNATGLVARLREIHQPQGGEYVGPAEEEHNHCRTCAWETWPCQTAQALDLFAPRTEASDA